jgi:transcriptional regulator with XRE-family HTH domain
LTSKALLSIAVKRAGRGTVVLKRKTRKSGRSEPVAELDEASMNNTAGQRFAELDEASMNNTVGQRLRMVRKARGLTAADVAVACQVSNQAVSQWERNKYAPHIKNLDKAATLLKVSLEWLRTGRGKAPDLRIIPIKGRKAPPRPPQEAIVAPLPDMIPEQAMGIGAGPLTLNGRIHDWWKLPSGLVHETLRTAPAYLVVLRVLSDTMEPTIKLHDHVVIDRADTEPLTGKIYAIDNGISVILRRITVEGDRLTLRSDRAPDQDVIEVARADVRIVGRCVVAVILT